MFDNPTDNHTDIEVPLYYKLRFTKLKSEGPINLTNHWRKRLWISLHVDLKRLNTETKPYAAIICQPEERE